MAWWMHPPPSSRPADINRFASLKIGRPSQEVELDLDMLSSDFLVYSTTSEKGSRYDDFFSKSMGKLATTAPDPTDEL